MSVTNNLKLQKEIDVMVHHIIRELIGWTEGQVPRPPIY